MNDQYGGNQSGKPPQLYSVLGYIVKGDAYRKRKKIKLI